jgi:hypothetical protein
MAASLDVYVRRKSMHPDRFNSLFEGRNEHFIWHIARMFEAFKGNEFRTPWKGEWFTAEQAFRLITILYDHVPNVMTTNSMAIIQYVIDPWNISAVFGESSVYTHLCGKPYPETVPPTTGPEERLNSEGFARLLRI